MTLSLTLSFGQDDLDSFEDEFGDDFGDEFLDDDEGFLDEEELPLEGDDFGDDFGDLICLIVLIVFVLSIL